MWAAGQPTDDLVTENGPLNEKSAVQASLLVTHGSLGMTHRAQDNTGTLQHAVEIMWIFAQQKSICVLQEMINSCIDFDQAEIALCQLPRDTPQHTPQTRG